MYVQWWKLQSFGFFLLEIYRQENRDEVRAASTQDPTFLVNQVPPIHPSRYKYDNYSQASPEFPRVSFCTIRSDSECNPVEVPLQAPDPPPFSYDVNWGTR
ncbi:hypothetical protein MKW92_051604, partial [Papaver armeniacum]